MPSTTTEHPPTFTTLSRRAFLRAITRVSKEEMRMRGPVVLLVTLAVVASTMTPAPAQDLTQVFKSVNSSVVVIRTREKEVSEAGQLTKFGEVGSGVLISQDGTVMTQRTSFTWPTRSPSSFWGAREWGLGSLPPKRTPTSRS
jgi:S1-C subfamily serine protease